MKKPIKIKIQAHTDREEIVKSLANSGYKVWVEQIYVDVIVGAEYFVCFEL